VELELVSGETSQMIHDNVYAPKHDLFLIVGLLFCLQVGPYVVEDSYEKPDPDVVLPGLGLAFAIVDGVFQKIFTDS